jgi:hypothetical protein
MKIEAAAITSLVVAHHAIAYLHGGAHADLAIELSALQDLFVDTIIVGVPLVGVVLLWTRLRRVGLAAIVVGMIGALLFGVYHHYMLVSPDHISHLPQGPQHAHGVFVWTAGAIAMLEGVTAAAAAYALGAPARGVETRRTAN